MRNAPQPSRTHRCPSCSATRIERRTPRGVAEQLSAVLLNRRPYVCLECGERFRDRTTTRRDA